MDIIYIINEMRKKYNYQYNNICNIIIIFYIWYTLYLKTFFIYIELNKQKRYIIFIQLI